MPTAMRTAVLLENHFIESAFLNRKVIVDCYLPTNIVHPEEINLLLVNDGQDLVTMHFEEILDELYKENSIEPILCVGIHCGEDRKNEYGTADVLDYKGRGAKAALYTSFIFEELLPFIKQTYLLHSFKETSFAGFSLGGLSAFDIAWKHQQSFTKIGVFSGSFWWRDEDQYADNFDENIHRIAQRQVREGAYAPWLHFFFEVGTLDETADRNNNGIIDAIDDTLAVIEELQKLGYDHNNIAYLQLEDGRHDVATWARSFPTFLKWGWGK